MHNGLTENWTYNNSRMQPLSVAASKGSSTLLTLDTWYCAGASPAQDCATNNGNIMQAWAGPNATPAYKQTFGYDSLNRLSSATEGAPWAQSYGYDIYGNRWATGTGPGIDSTTPSTSAWYDVTTNHMVNALLPVAYDDAGAGNLKTLSGYLFSYDGENRMVRSTLNGIDTNYAYDGDGRRVQKTGSNSTTFVYDARGALAAEYSTQAPPVAGTEYVTVDQLGSTRLTSDASGNPIAYHDYVPFGAEIPAGVNGRSNLYGAADGVNKKFTGQYRDTETQSSAMTSGLDYFGARYFSAAQGRFTTPDWSEKPQPIPYADIANPQSLNLYVYEGNSPLANVDLDGHGCPPDCSVSTWDRVGMAVHGTLDLVGGVAKLGAAAGSGASTPITGPAGVAGAAYGGISGTGQIVGGGFELVGSVLPSKYAKDAQRSADLSISVTTVSGFVTLATTGDPAKSAAAASVESLGTRAATGKILQGIENIVDTLSDIHTILDTAQKIQPPPPPPPPPPPSSTPKKQ